MLKTVDRIKVKDNKSLIDKRLDRKITILWLNCSSFYTFKETQLTHIQLNSTTLHRLFVLCLTLIAFSAFSQSKLDSLWNVWNNPTVHDSLKLQAIHVINREAYLFAQPDSSFILGEEQFKLAKKINHEKWMAEARNTQGIAMHIQGNYLVALDYYNKSIKLAKKAGLDKSLAGSLNNMGIIHKDQGNTSQALNYFKESLILKEAIGDENGLANTLGNIGEIHVIEGDYLKGLELFERGLKIKEKLNQSRGEAGFLNNIGSVYSELEQYEKALTFFNKSLAIRRASDNKQGIASTLTNIAAVHLNKGEYQKAITFGKEALAIAQKAKVIVEENAAADQLYKTYEASGNYKMALKMLELFLKTNEIIKNDKTQEILIQQDYKIAYEKERLSDSIKRAEENKVAEAQYAAKDAENKRNLLMIQKRSEQAYYLYGILGLALLFTFFIFTRFRIARKQKEIIESQKNQVDLAYEELEEKNTEILDSINYAKRIQTAILPPFDTVQRHFPNCFILYKPKDIVAGDFYWLETKNSLTLLAVADCTGHGVPGAMVSVICNNGLNRSVREHGLTSPGEILNKTREIVIEEFEKSENEVKDGMDIALFTINGMELQYAGANNPLWILRENEIIELKADKQPIGKFVNPQPYSTKKLTLEKGDCIYAFTDGYADQFGGEKNKKLKSKFLKELLHEIKDTPMDQQKSRLNLEFEQWRGNQDQIDDVCIIGIRI